MDRRFIMTDTTSTIHDFLEAAAARTPTPGGGAVTALAGALAVTMGQMVINYSVGRKGHEAFTEELTNAQRELLNARNVFAQLVMEDQAAFEALRDAKKMPDGPDKQATLNAAILACVRVPEAIGATAVRVLEIADSHVDHVNPYLLSDLAVCADLAMATVRCAIYSVRANLPEITDPADVQSIEATVNQLRSRALKLVQSVSPRIWARYEQNG